MLILSLPLSIVYDDGPDYLACPPPSSANLLHKINEPIRLLHVNHGHDSLDVDACP
ncbi:hypothetical protein FOWG_18199 [Fusarium oxysporum f. sp. lycopersici MN25]|jgi:hypothetical protein|nr:hypothetical protein FOWG_18199 [Fusarium oxysporum f. sp. lycopersici MN25]